MSTDTLTTDTAATGSADAPRRGRPRQHASAAERQRAYRQRLKEQGRRVIQRLVADVRGAEPLSSDIIDLSEVSPTPPSHQRKNKFVGTPTS